MAILMGEHLVTTKADIQTCRRCGAITLAGISEGLSAVVGITPIPADHEPTYTADGLATYTLRGGRLEYRDPDWRPPGPCTVLATHVCPPPPQRSLW